MHLNLDLKPGLNLKQQHDTKHLSFLREHAHKNCCRFLHPKSICAEERAEITAPDVAELEIKK